MYLRTIYLLHFCWIVMCFQDLENYPVKVSTTDITLGLTSLFNVECLIDKKSDTSLAALFSLILLHSKSPEVLNFTELMAINNVEGLTKNSDLGSLSATGVIDNNGISYINMTFVNPTKDNSGVYKCEAHGYNTKGRPVTLSSTKRVEVRIPTVDTAVTEIKLLKAKLEKLNENFEELVSRVETLHNLYFFVSTKFNGRKYLLSKVATNFSPSFGETSCAQHGGYLAEVDSLKELEFVKQFVQTYGAHFVCIMIGGSDEEREGVWVNRHSKTPVASLWAAGEPNNFGNEDCQCFHAGSLYDAACVFSASDNVGFICEISNQ